MTWQLVVYLLFFVSKEHIFTQKIKENKIFFLGAVDLDLWLF